jgi:ATP-dependent Lon protease
MQGDVMKESMNVAKTVVWRILSKSHKKRLMNEWKKNGTTGLHVHCPDGSTRKNGPSAGAGIATSMYSRLTNSFIDRTVAMTGELNLSGDVTAIGGLEEKMFGAITAGVKTILFPKDNQRDCDKIKEKFPDLFDKDSSAYIEMIAISRIEEIFDRVILN